jgi:GMP synthase (glutamine-hydrolysing) A subunit
MMDRIAILDFGAQYTQLIARRIRELGVYSEILPCTQPVEDVLAAGYKGIVLSGGPASVYDDEAPLPDKRLFEAGIPLLGICYGMQAMGYLLGATWCPRSDASTVPPSSGSSPPRDCSRASCPSGMAGSRCG